MRILQIKLAEIFVYIPNVSRFQILKKRVSGPWWLLMDLISVALIYANLTVNPLQVFGPRLHVYPAPVGLLTVLGFWTHCSLIPQPHSLSPIPWQSLNNVWVFNGWLLCEEKWIIYLIIMVIYQTMHFFLISDFAMFA